MSLPLRHALAAAASASVRFRRGLSTATSRPPWAMVYRTKLVVSSARRVSLKLAEPPCPSHLVKPPLLPGQENMLLRLPDIDGTKKSISCSKMGIVTKSELPHQPPDRYAVAALNQEQYWERGQQRFLMRRFLSQWQKGEWDNLVSLPSPLPVARRLQCIDHDVVAFAGRLWWVDVGWGAVSADPFSDQPDLHFVELPKGRVTEYDVDGTRELGRYRRMEVSEGRMRYVEVSQEKPFVLSSFVLDNDGSSWMLEHQMALSPLLVDGVHPNHTPRIGVVDPLNSSIIHLTIGNIALVVNMAKEEVLGCSELAEAGTRSSNKADFRSKTLSDILVREDRSKKN
ncbi:hypothetical protein QOZ80_5AG0370090 [Eleusine coracana subsp. coracana]|nr:hypothetical protein QOZ80_5AG0370090 [Eleusine coracana subsp. coracana]